MAQQHIFDKVKGLGQRVHPVTLIQHETPVHGLQQFGNAYGHQNLYIKREDMTDTTYGGNKVRNLEYVLGEALNKGCTGISTLIPYGSNFTGALSAQARKVCLIARLSQFVIQRNPQIEAHVRFGKKQGAVMSTFDNPVGLPMAVVHAGLQSMRKDTYYISPGASNVLGVLGHANALLEAVNQFKKTKAQMPDRIVVGAGTCGTIAGLHVGTILSGEKIKITGVRCAEPIVCNSRRVVSLVNQTLQFLGSSAKIKSQDVELVECPNNDGYARPNDKAIELMQEFFSLEGIHLDTTYTSKVVLFLASALQQGMFRSERVLYWHTFSPAAQGVS